MKNIPGFLLRYGILILSFFIVIIFFLSSSIEFNFNQKINSSTKIISNTELNIVNPSINDYQNLKYIKFNDNLIPIVDVSLSHDKKNLYIKLQEHNHQLNLISENNAIKFIVKKNILQLIFKEFF
ncbi:hypothetical protein C8N46_102548 [Kordia periserrulae]|uniref:Uncharacterized protein n=1 Tax=Kordia periserrulae TaxID=701523 RepID=A0A2T6C4C5_9FLAO|nr:hypothetical protein C8N46_102548 [Kordia periserrulae]